MTGDTKKKILLAVIAIVPAMISGVLSNCQARYEAKLKDQRVAIKAEENSNAVLEGYKPAIAELQKILKQSRIWSSKADEELKKLQEDVKSLREGVAYCRAYVQFDSRGRYHYETEPEEPDNPISVLWNNPPVANRPKAKLPDNVKKAKIYVDARQQMKCDPADPLCGISALE